MARRTTKVAICLSVCVTSQTFVDCGQGSRCGGPGEVPKPVWPAHRALCTPCASLGLKKPGDFIVSEGHGYPLVKVKNGKP
jgi:hypothetical protein